MRSSRLVLLTIALFLLSGSVAAQTGTLTGTVADAETGAPVANANVEILGAGGGQATGMLSNQSGQFRFTLPEGTYSVVVSLIGYQNDRVDGVRVTAGQVANVTVRLTSQAFALNPLVVTASRREEKILESPASVSIVGTDLIEERPALTVIEHMKSLAGVDIVQTGLQQSNVVARGFNNIFSGSLLSITDNRYASVPSLRVNAFNFIPLTNMDIERMEVVLGPGAALYGPNAASGVAHVITKSPIDSEGTEISLAGGERSVFQGAFRHATAVSERFGFKISGQYFQGKDWRFTDPDEVAAREDDPSIPARDFDSQRYGGEVRFDFRPDDGSELIFTGGLNNALSSIELTGIGAGQADGWKYWYGQTRYRNGNFFIQGFVNGSDAGDTFLLRTGNQIVDKSLLLAGQVQHAVDLGDRQSFIYGIDVQQTIPRTEGTVTGSNEDDDKIFEIGGYVHSETSLSDQFDLVAALRVDKHDRLEDPNFSPRAALVFRPAPEQNFRVTFNRAFSTPTTNNLFLDLRAGRIPLTPQIGYDVRTRGVPKSGFTFDETCPGGFQNYCMISPFAPTAGRLPASAAVLWDGLIDVLAAGSPALAPLAPALKGNTAAVTVLRRFDQEARTFVLDPVGPEAIERIKSTITNTVEVGYKGLLANKVLLAADVYRTQINDFVGPLRVETPTVFLEPGQAAQFLTQRLTALAQAGQFPANLIAPTVQQAVGTLAMLPLGTIAPDQLSSPDLILTYRNFGDVSFWGADLSVQILVSPTFSLRGTYSWVQEDCFAFSEGAGGSATASDCTSPLDIALNAPKSKGSFSARYYNASSGLTLEGRVRGSAGFPMNSGVYVGDVDGYAVLDANVNLRLNAVQGATIGLYVTNLFDNRHQEFIGAPELGRLVMGRVTYTLP